MPRYPKILPELAFPFSLLFASACAPDGANSGVSHDDDDDDDDDDNDDDGNPGGGGSDDDGNAGGGASDNDGNPGGGGSDDDDNGDDDDDSGDDDDNGDDSEGSGGGGSDDADASLPEDGSIDALEDGDSRIENRGGRIGYWYTYNDGTDGSEQEPEQGAAFKPVDGGPGDSKYAAHTRGNGHEGFGAAMGFDLQLIGDEKKTYDVSAWDGIKFKAKGENGIDVRLVTSDVLSEKDGGTCVPEGEHDCGDSHRKAFTLTDEWVEYAVRFDQIYQETWGVVTDFDPKHLISVEFLANKDWDPDLEFEFSIDDVKFFDGDDGKEKGEWDLLAGFRSSNYGIDPFPDAEYWGNVGEDFAESLNRPATPSAIWIVGTITDWGSCELEFGSDDGEEYDNIGFSDDDWHEETLNHFDDLGFEIYLQVEAGFADVPTLIDLVLSQYSHHPSVIGFGVDVEWHQSTEPDLGLHVNDEWAKAWIDQIRSYNPDYGLMLKHFAIDAMPETYREGILFVDDTQIFDSLDDCIQEEIWWGNYFWPAKVGFQYGYEEDQSWWGQLDDPTADFTNALLDAVPNTAGVYWVDFTLYDVFPP